MKASSLFSTFTGETPPPSSGVDFDRLMLIDQQGMEPDSASEAGLTAINSSPVSSIETLLYTPAVMEPDSTSESNVNDNLADVDVDVSSNSNKDAVSRRVLQEGQGPAIVCPVVGCQSAVKHKRNVERHIANFHGAMQKSGRDAGRFGIKRWVCRICGKSNVYKTNYVRHYNGKHSDLICDMDTNCIERFTEKPELQFK